MSENEYADFKDPKTGRFLEGNPGRQKGTRHRIGGELLRALEKDFNEGGAEAIKKMRETDPVAYVRALISLLPKEVKIEAVNDLSDDELDARITGLIAALGVEVGTVEPASGEGQAAPDEPAGGVSTVH